MALFGAERKESEPTLEQLFERAEKLGSVDVDRSFEVKISLEIEKDWVVIRENSKQNTLYTNFVTALDRAERVYAFYSMMEK